MSYNNGGQRSIRDCVQDAIERWQDGGENGRYTKSYAAEEPHCIISVFGRGTRRNLHDGQLISVAIYNVDGGAKRHWDLE